MSKTRETWFRRHKILILIVVLELLAVVFAWSFIVPGTLEHIIESKVEENCETCHLKIGAIGMSLFSPGDFTFTDVHFSSGVKDALEIKATVKAIYFHISLHQLVKKRLYVRGLDIERPDVWVIDGDKKTPKKKDDGAPMKMPDLALLPSKFHNGEFKYTRNHEGTTATISVHQIEGGIGRFEPRLKKETEVYLQARYEKTGQATLLVTTNPLAKPFQVNVKLGVEKQDLQDLTTFLKPNAGVELKGEILRAKADVDVFDEGHGHAQVWVEYKDLDVKVDKESDRSAIAAFFITLGSAITMNKENVGAPKEIQTADLALEREDKEDKSGKESLIHFILRGMKEASMKVAQASHLKVKEKQK